MRACVRACACVRVRACVCVCVRVRARVCMCVCVCVRARVHSLRTVSTDKSLRFINAFIIIINCAEKLLARGRKGVVYVPLVFTLTEIVL